MNPRALTSASCIARRAACPGSAFAEMGILDERSDYSDEGTFLHPLALAMVSPTAPRPENPPILTTEQTEALDEFCRLFRLFESDVKDQFGISDGEPFVDEVEQEVIVYGVNGNALYPGHLDLCRTWPAKSVRLIIDAKFGRLDVEEAPDNTQLASYGVGKFQESPVEHTAVGILQPRNFGPGITTAVYDAHAIGAALTELERIVVASRDPSAPRVAGLAQCRYCRAKLFCDAYKSSLLPVEQTLAVDLVSNDDLERLHEIVKRAALIGEQVTAELRKRIAGGDLPGWKLQSTGETKTLTDTVEAYRRFLVEFPTEPILDHKFMACMKASLTKLASLYSEITGKPAKAARAETEDLLSGLIETKPKEATPKKL